MVDHELITLLAHEELDIDTALRGCRDGTQQACIAGRNVTLVAIMTDSLGFRGAEWQRAPRVAWTG